MNEIWSCPARSLFASLTHLCGKEFIVPGVPPAPRSLSQGVLHPQLTGSSSFHLKKKNAGMGGEGRGDLKAENPSRFRKPSEDCSLRFSHACRAASGFARCESLAACICSAVGEQHLLSTRTIFRCICSR